MNAIETQYKGYRFRSRLEARWAVFFDALRIEWKYEHEGYEVGGHRYLPDFWLPKLDCWVEVKGDPDGLRKEYERMRAVLGPKSPLPRFASGDTSLIVLGDIPEPRLSVVQLHPVLTRGSGILQRSWGFFVTGKSGDTQFFGDRQQSVLCTLFGKYSFADPAESPDSSAWKVETWALETPGTFEHPNEAYRAARQARFEHGDGAR